MNGVTRISSEQDVMMITFTEADTASALADALTAFAQKRRCCRHDLPERAPCRYHRLQLYNAGVLF